MVSEKIPGLAKDHNPTNIFWHPSLIIIIILVIILTLKIIGVFFILFFSDAYVSGWHQRGSYCLGAFMLSSHPAFLSSIVSLANISTENPIGAFVRFLRIPKTTIFHSVLLWFLQIFTIYRYAHLQSNFHRRSPWNGMKN